MGNIEKIGQFRIILSLLQNTKSSNVIKLFKIVQFFSILKFPLIWLWGHNATSKDRSEKKS